ncbi:PhoX family protein [Frankia sp. Cpl3]|nr:PhoX family protein [Frankia sp. Cpl3]
MAADSQVGPQRRGLLKGAAVLGGAALAGPFSSLSTRIASAAPIRGGGYGPLYPAADRTTGLELLRLPRGFEYMSFGWTGDPMTDGSATPGAHDGMAAFRHNGNIHLVRNHERGTGAPIGTGGIPTYDSTAAGGTTTVVFDPDQAKYIETRPSLAGTIRNCAGGPTPWGTWLSCEETTTIGSKRHGYVFEVPADGVSDAMPIPAMGRFSHEATAVDHHGYVYLSEDATPGGWYRFTPNTQGRLADGGRLEMLAIRGEFRKNLRGAVGTGTTLPVEWVPIANPDPDTGNGVVQQGLVLGAAEFARPEGLWYGNRLVYMTATSGGAAGQGQVFAYNSDTMTLTCVFESPAANVLNFPDNITVSPRGGLVLCEDGSGREFLHGLSTDGLIFQFAENNVVIPGDKAVNGISGDFTGSEWCGACFDNGGGGNWLFVNIQSPGITFAITGPWRQGIL